MQLYGFASIVALLTANAFAAPMPDKEMNLMSRLKRQTSDPCNQWTPQTRLVGDGSPKDWWLSSM
jgi:uncharacterized protein YegL